MSLDATFPLVSFSRDYSFSIELDLEGDTSGDNAETFAIAESAIHLYGTTGGNLAATGTLLKEIETDLNSSGLAGDFPSWGGASFAWSHGPGRDSLKWTLAIDLGETAVAGSLSFTVGDSREPRHLFDGRHHRDRGGRRAHLLGRVHAGRCLLPVYA